VGSGADPDHDASTVVRTMRSVTKNSISFASASMVLMINAFDVLGKAAFRRWPLGEKQQRGPINRAVFESQSIALADYPLDYLRAHKDEIMTARTSIASTSTPLFRNPMRN